LADAPTHLRRIGMDRCQLVDGCPLNGHRAVRRFESGFQVAGKSCETALPRRASRHEGNAKPTRLRQAGLEFRLSDLMLLKAEDRHRTRGASGQAPSGLIRSQQLWLNSWARLNPKHAASGAQVGCAASRES